MQLRSLGRKARLLTRKGLDWSARIPQSVAAGEGIDEGIIDGEVVALNAEGASDFAALQGAIADRKTEDLVFFAFDQLFAGRVDLRPLPLADRKARLRTTLADAPVNLRYVEHFNIAGEAVLQSACRMDLEGIVSKRLDAPYRSGRGESWVKSKCRGGHEVVIGGWVTSGEAFRSLLAGVHRDGKLVPVGRIGTGFGRDRVRRLLPRLEALETSVNPFAGKGAPRKTAAIHWVRPELVAEIDYAGFTGAGQIRQAAFKELRDDKAAEEVEAEAPAPAATTALSQPAPWRPREQTVTPPGSARVTGIALSHAGKALSPDARDGRPVTKRDLARYYEAVGTGMIGHVEGRPCSLVRMPDGITGDQTFFQRQPARGRSSLTGSVEPPSERRPYLRFDRVEALVAATQVAAAQAAAVELHPCNGRPSAPERPGRLVFDLDPAPDVASAEVIGAACAWRERLEGHGLVGFYKTTGGKGLHVVVPLTAEDTDWSAAKGFAHDLCQTMAAAEPQRSLIKMSKTARAGRIFLDYLRNDRMATAVAPLSPRGRPGAPVSMPLDWSDVAPGLDPAAFTLRNVPALLAETTAWRDYRAAERPLSIAIERLAKRWK